MICKYFQWHKTEPTKKNEKIIKSLNRKVVHDSEHIDTIELFPNSFKLDAVDNRISVEIAFKNVENNTIRLLRYNSPVVKCSFLLR